MRISIAIRIPSEMNSDSRRISDLSRRDVCDQGYFGSRNSFSSIRFLKDSIGVKWTLEASLNAGKLYQS